MLNPQLRQIHLSSVILEHDPPPCSETPGRRTSSGLARSWEECARLCWCRLFWLPFRDGRRAGLACASNRAREVSALYLKFSFAVLEVPAPSPPALQ